MAFLIAFAVDENDVITDICSLDITDFSVSGSCIESNGQHHFVSRGQEGREIKSG